MYSEIKTKIKPFDIILIKGGEFISNVIRFIQQNTLVVPKMKDVWSHVGLVVTRELLDDKRLEPGKLYLIESTMSGRLNDGIKNIDGNSFFGVQIRDLDKIVKKYTSHKKTSIAWSRLHNNPFTDETEAGKKKRKEIQAAFTELFPKRWEGIRYDWNLISLAAAAWPIFKPLKWISDKINIFDNKDWLFCSELVFDILQVFQFYDGHFDSSLVLPQDLIGFDASTPSIPKIFDDPIEIK